MTQPSRILSQRPIAAMALLVIIVTAISGCVSAPPKQAAEHQYTPSEMLSYSATLGNLALTQKLLDAGVNPDLADDHGVTPLLLAVEGGHGDIVAALLAKGADPNIGGGKDNATPLMRAASNAHADILSQLLRADAKVDTQDRLGATALMWAAFKGCHSCADRLLTAGALIDVRGRTGETALWLAAVNSDAAMVTRLLRADANPTLPNLNGSTPLQEATARKKWDIVKALKTHATNK